VAVLVLEDMSQSVEGTFTATSGYAITLLGVPYKVTDDMNVADIGLTCVCICEVDLLVAYLCFCIIKRNHVLEQTIQNTFNFE
jgi:hypothetical protein